MTRRVGPHAAAYRELLARVAIAARLTAPSKRTRLLPTFQS
jgi:hypothetical protein